MRKNIHFPVIILLIILSSCNEYYKIEGFAQGTTYHITYGITDSVNYKPQIDSILDRFDQSLSVYIPGSVISKINSNEDLKTDPLFEEVFEVSVEINKLSNGAFDLTVMPLVNAWGFGPGDKRVVDSMLIDSIMTFVGMDKIWIEDGELKKSDPGVTLDVNAVAQGYSVDIIAGWFDEQGVKNYMVEVGGEIRTKGKNPSGTAWRIGIDKPEFGNMIPGQQLQAIVKLPDKALATSGNYRKYFELDGIKYTHSIDPLTGYPSRQKILSATIISDECIRADAIATACMVMGLEKSKSFLDQLDNAEAYLIYGDDSGKFRIYMTDGFQEFLADEF